MYTHGLEKIYAFENINAKSVKTLGSQPKKEAPQQPVQARYEPLTLAFGPYFQEGLPSIRLHEPISSLGLSSFALKALDAKGYQTVAEAYQFISQDPALHKGLGQSHQEEIEAKILAFVGTSPYMLQKKQDLESLVRYGCKDLLPKQRFLLLARFQLQELAPLSSMELQELQREKPQLKVPDLQLDPLLQDITDAYIRPWLNFRHGISPASEIDERLLQICLIPKHFRNIMRFLRSFGDPIKLIMAEHEVYVSDTGVHKDYMLVRECAKSYFYKSCTRYSLTGLCRLVEKELALKGIGFQEGFIEKVITSSGSFLKLPDSVSGCSIGIA